MAYSTHTADGKTRVSVEDAVISAGDLDIGNVDVEFAGVSARATTAIADNDTGAPGANEVLVNAFYK